METATEIPQRTEIPDAEAQDPYVLSPAEESELLAGHGSSLRSRICQCVRLSLLREPASRRACPSEDLTARR